MITLHDDLDGSEAKETFSFSLDGTEYVIDLNKTNAEKRRAALLPFVAAARTEKASTRRVRSRRRGNAKVRAWARGNGIKVAARGTISAEALERYNAAH